MSRIYDNWERLVAATLKKEQLWQMFHAPSISISSQESDSSLSSSFSNLYLDFEPDNRNRNETGHVVVTTIGGRNGQLQPSGMELFRKAKSVRLKSRHDIYLTAHPDEESVVVGSSGSSKAVHWTVEFVEGVEYIVRLKSCYGKYLQASDEWFLLELTGRKVAQALPRKLDSSVEWEPISDGNGKQVKLKTRYGNFLRANGAGLPPWRNSISHDIPDRHPYHDGILWEVDVVEIRPEWTQQEVSRFESLEEEEDFSSSAFNPRFPGLCSGSYEDSSRKSEGRLIYYYVAGDDGDVNDVIEGPSFQFKGRGLEQLTQKLEEETGLVDIIVCSRYTVTGKLYRLRLPLPPSNATMHVVVIPASSRSANDFMPPAPTFT